VHIGPFIHATLAVCDFVIIPIISVCRIAINWQLVSASIYGDYLALNLIISVVIMCWAPFTLVHAVKTVVRQVQAEKLRLFKKSAHLTSSQQLIDDCDSDELAYSEHKQEPGNGKKRLG
jgi:hypothetical protein